MLFEEETTTTTNSQKPEANHDLPNEDEYFESVKYSSGKVIGSFPSIERLCDMFYDGMFPKCLLITANQGMGKGYFVKTLISTIYSKKGIVMDLNTPEGLESNTDVLILKNEYEDDDFKSLYSNNILIEQCRSVVSFVYKTPKMLEFKFVVIDSVDNLSKQSANSLLKVLEDGSTTTYFILTLHNSFNILPTIKSRSIEYKVPPLSLEEYKEVLQIKGVGFEKTMAELSHLSPGLSSLLVKHNYLGALDAVFNPFIKKTYSYEYLSYSPFLIVLILKVVLLSIAKNDGVFAEYQFIYSQNRKMSEVISCYDYICSMFKDFTIYNTNKDLMLKNSIDAFYKLLK